MNRKKLLPVLAVAAVLAVILAASGVGRGDMTERHVLVAYFSATGTTKSVAETAATALRADVFRIVPEEPYTDEDLGHGADARVTREQADPASACVTCGGCAQLLRAGIPAGCVVRDREVYHL